VKLTKTLSAGASPRARNIAPIACIYCGKAARLIRRAPHPQMGPNIEKRTFECGSCHKLTEIAVAR
jgi:hypothetical protein